MILLAGAFELVPLLAVLVLAVALSLPSALGWGALASVFGAGTLGGVGAATSMLALGAITEYFARRRKATRDPLWVSTLAALGGSQVVRRETVGGKASVLARLVALGAPVPEALVLTTALVERIHEATAGGNLSAGAWAALPAAARREMDGFLAGTKGKVVVRASFTDAAGAFSYAGVFPAVRDVDPGDREALLRAVLTLVASSDDAVAREYRRRRNAGPGIARAVVLQRQIEPELVGTVASRGPSGRADSVTVDCARRRSPVRSYRYDLVDGHAAPLGVDERFETPAWMHRIAALAVTLEKELGSPVHLEFALQDGQLYLLDARRLPAAQRKTWVHAAPLDSSEERLPRFAQELRGGLPLARAVLSETLARAGATGDVTEEEVRYVDGLIYVDAEVIRRALAQLGADVLLRGGARVTLRAIQRVERRPIPRVPTVTDVTGSAWSELRAWHRAHLVGAARARLELVSREWLIRCLLRLTDPPGAAVEDRRGHPGLLFLLGRRLREAASEAGRQLDLLAQAEAELGSAVARLLARGAEGWSQMFKGDRHLHANLEEIDRWHQDVAERDSLESEWRARREAFDARRGEPTVPRVHRPALFDAGSGEQGRKASGVGVVPGVATGPAVLVTGRDAGVGAGAILLVTDPRSEVCPHIYEARGVVLLTGGLASPVAALAAELSIPTVLCPSARGLSTRDVRIDGSSGEVVVVR